MSPDRRRRQLLDAAAGVFARNGYRSASISNIVARAGVARGTFYLYFDSKEHIFRSVIDRFHLQIKDAFTALDAAAATARHDGPRAVLEASFRQWLEFFAAHRDVTRVVLREAGTIDARFEQAFADLRQSAVTRFSARFRKFQELGFVRSSLDPDLAARFQLGIFDELLNQFILKDEHPDIRHLADQLADFEWFGVRHRED